ncbi:MAG: hypothetical protein AAF138_00345 [Planctomycetota bacterium]
MRLTVSDLARSFHSLDRLDEASARKRLRLARDLGRDAPLVAWSVTLFVFAAALAAVPEIESWSRSLFGQPVSASLAEQLATWALPAGGLLAAVLGLCVRDWMLGRALAKPETLRRCVTCDHDLTDLPESSTGDVRCPECGRVSSID